MLPAGASRPLALLALGSLALAASAQPPLHAGGGLAVLVLASVAAWASRSTLFLLAVRKGHIAVSDAGRPHALGRIAAAAAAIGALAATPLLAIPAAYARTTILVACAIGVAVGITLFDRDRGPRSPRARARGAWLVMDTAIPAGVLAAAIGACVAVLHLHDATPVPPESLARHMAGTTFLYAVLLGVGGFSKAWTEQRAGLVVVEPTVMEVPGPMAAGLALGIAQLFVIPRVTEPLPFEQVIILKACAGFVLGGALSLLGAVRGARAASGATGTTARPAAR